VASRPDQGRDPLYAPIWRAPGDIAIGLGCRCATCRKRAACWSAFTSASRSYVPISGSVRGAAAASVRICCCRCASWSARCRSAIVCRRSRSPSASTTRRPCRAGVAHPRAAECGRRNGLLRDFATATVSIWLQPADRGRPRFHAPGGRDSRTRCRISASRMPFSPTEFTQVNPAHQPRARAPRDALLAPQAGRAHRRHVLRARQLHPADRRARAPRWSASRAADSLVAARPTRTPAANGLSARREFAVANLFAATPESLAAARPLDKMLIDPPREGAPDRGS
jgi:hypothetical protein